MARQLHTLGIEFQKIVKERRLELFDAWLAKVESSEVNELKGWAGGLLADEKPCAMHFRWNGATGR